MKVQNLGREVTTAHGPILALSALLPGSLHLSTFPRASPWTETLQMVGPDSTESHLMWPCALLYFQASAACHPCQSPWPVLASSACHKKGHRLCGFQQQSLTVSQF